VIWRFFDNRQESLEPYCFDYAGAVDEDEIIVGATSQLPVIDSRRCV